MVRLAVGFACLAAVLGALCVGASAGDLDWSDPATLPPPKVAPIGWPSREADLDALPGFIQPPAGYGEVPFYWWLGDKLTKERLAWQLDLLEQSGGVSGLQINYAHTDHGGRSYGLTMPSDPPLFSEAWWDLLRWFMGEAKRRGMAVSLSDYTLCTPGQGWWTDEIIKENPDINGYTLGAEVRDVAGGTELKLELPENIVSVTAFQAPNGAIAPSAGIALPIEPRLLKWKAPEGAWKVALISRNRAQYSIDPMNPLSGAKYNEKFFGRFEDRNPGEGGRGLNFFFSDELELGIGGNMWNDGFAAEFQKRKGYDIRPELAAIFTDIGPRTPKVRLDYRDVVVSLSEENFFRPLFDWHYSRGMTFGCDHGGRGKNVVEFGDYFRTQRWMTGPGNDQPGLASDVIKTKVNSSISHLYQRPRVWLEGYYGSGWGTTSGQLADATFRNFVRGHNLLSLHGLYYSLHGGWWEWAPPCNHFRMPYWAHMRTFFDCTRRLSYLMSQGTHRCDVAIMYPVAPMEAGMGGEQSVGTAFSAGEQLYNTGEDFDFIDFESLARAKIENKELRVSGEAYRVLVLPAMAALRQSTLDKALAFYRAGGTVIAIGALPEASDRVGRDDPQLDAAVKEIFGVTAAEAKAGKAAAAQGSATGGRGLMAADIGKFVEQVNQQGSRDFLLLPKGGGSVCHRKIGSRDVYMVVGAAKGSECVFRAKGKVELWDPWTGGCRPLHIVSQSAEGTRVRMPLETFEAQVIVFSPGEAAATVESTEVTDVTELSVKAGKVTLRGVATTAGKKTAKVCVGGKFVDLMGEVPAAPAVETIGGLWQFELKPTMDNRFGDFQWPPTAEVIGAKVERFRYVQEDAKAAKGWGASDCDDSQWPKVTVGYGPRFWKLGPLPDGVDLSAVEAKLAELHEIDPAVPVEVGGKRLAWQPYAYSTRYGVEGDPGHEGYHGLKNAVSDDFIALGKVTFSMTGSDYQKEEGGSRYFLWTSAATQRDGKARVLIGGMKPAAAWVDGAKLGDGLSVDLKAGNNPVLLRYDAPGRGHFVLDTNASPGGEAPETTETFTRKAYWIWQPGDNGAASDCFFRKAFEASAGKARLRVTCDNAYVVFLNGREVGAGREWSRVQEYDVSLLMKAGKNALAVAAHNDGGEAGLIVELLSGEGIQTKSVVATDSSWVVKAGQQAVWREAGFDDSAWTKAAAISPFAGSLWAKHPQGPPQVVSMATSSQPAFETSPLAMRWHGVPSLVPFDARPQDVTPAGWYRFTAPPAMKGMTITARGEVEAWADGKPMVVERLKTLGDGAKVFRALAAEPMDGCVKVALRIRQQRGCYGGAAISEPIRFDCAVGKIALGDWSQIDGLSAYSGGAWYRKTVSLPGEKIAGRVMLHLGDVAASVEVLVNGKSAGVKVAPPWSLDISALVKPGENRIEVLVYNTLANHYENIPTRYRGSPRSGLLGPVSIETLAPVVMEGEVPR